jgi:hypothetical protein
MNKIIQSGYGMEPIHTDSRRRIRYEATVHINDYDKKVTGYFIPHLLWEWSKIPGVLTVMITDRYSISYI